MKILLALALLPLSALADTDVRCTSANVHYNLIGSHGGIIQEGGGLTIVANGVLHTVIDTRIDSVDVSQPGKVIATVTTLNQDGEEDADSGKATVELDVNNRHDGNPGQNAHGAGLIHIIKNPPQHPSNIRFQPDYNLTGCVGSI
jgi:hypothetical protein